MSAAAAMAELERLRRRARRRALLGGLLAWAVVAVPVTALAVRLAAGAGLAGGALAAMLSGAWLASLAAAAFAWAWRPWRSYADRARFARRVDACAGGANLVVAAEEAARMPVRWPASDPVARELTRRLDDAALAALNSLTPSDLAPLRRLRPGLAALGVGAAGAMLLLAGDPAGSARGAALLLDPLHGEGRGEAALVAEPGADWVVAGGSVTLAALDHAQDPARAVAEVRFGNAAWSTLAATSSAVAPGDPAGAVPAGGDPGTAAHRRWQAVVADVREDFVWRFRRGDVTTAVGRVEVRHPPLLTSLSAVVEPPAYTGLPEQEVSRLPALIEVPAGSRVQLRAGSGSDLGAAWLDRPDEASQPMAASGRMATVSLTVDVAQSFSVRLRDRHGLESTAAVTHRLSVLADQAPAVSLERPGDDGLLPLDGRITLLVEATDDYGLRGLVLHASAGPGDGGGSAGIGPNPAGGSMSLPTAAGTIRLVSRALEGHAPALRSVLAIDLDAGALELLPGDELSLHVEATDNRAPGPGQMTRSRALRLALPSAAEVLASQAEAADQSRGELEEARRRGRELDADIERLARELLKNPATDWARRQEIEAALERQLALRRELERVAADLQAQMERLASGQLTSERQLERAAEMAELLAQPPSSGLAELLDRLARGEEPVAPEEVGQALDQVSRDQKDLARRLDAALALMQRLEDEQRLEGLSSLLEDMMRRQQELADQSGSLEERGATPPPGSPDPKAGAGELARRQQELSEELAGLQEKLEEALAAMEERRRGEGEMGEREMGEGERNKGEQGSQEGSEGGESPRERKDGGTGERQQAAEKALREALEKLKKQQAAGRMGQASRMLQEMDPGQAAAMQQQALRDLGSLYSVLMASRQAMQAAMKMEQVSSLRGLAADLLSLSRRQEELGVRIPAQLQDVRNVELTRQQHRLQKAALGSRERLSQLLEEAPNRIIKLLEKLDGLVEAMGGAVRALDEGRAAAARDEAGRSLAEANRIVIGLLTEAQMAGNGGGGGSQQQSASEQLQELARRQAELNGATDELRRMLADRGISQEARSRMQRLGQQQAELGRELGRVAEAERERPAGDAARLLGDMEELGRQMERLGGDVGDGQVDQGVLQRQDRFLGRLLDARNAARQRDWSTRRESKAALRTYQAQESGAEDGAPGPGPAVRPRLQRLEDAPLEYRELVRRYFAAVDSLQRGLENLP